jgi:RNA polymerase sigma factor (sigma-70 family)
MEDTSKSISENNLVWQAFKQGDRLAFEALYRQYAKVLYNYGRKLKHDPELVHDTIQDLFIELWRLREGIADVSHVKSYLFSSMRRLLVKKMNENRLNLSDSDDVFDRILAPTLAYEAEWIDSEMDSERVNRIKKALLSISEHHREVLTLRYYEDFTYEQIANILMINEQSARNLVQRALQKLRVAALLTVLIVWVFHFFKRSCLEFF